MIWTKVWTYFICLPCLLRTMLEFQKVRQVWTLQYGKAHGVIRLKPAILQSTSRKAKYPENVLVRDVVILPNLYCFLPIFLFNSNLLASFCWSMNKNMYFSSSLIFLKFPPTCQWVLNLDKAFIFHRYGWWKMRSENFSRVLVEVYMNKHFGKNTCNSM